MEAFRDISFAAGCCLIAFVVFTAIGRAVESYRHRHRWINESSEQLGVNERGYRRVRMTEYCPDCKQERATIILLPNGGSGTAKPQGD